MDPPKTYVLPPATKLGLIALTVRDLERSLQFYQHVLGLRLIQRQDQTARLGSPGGSALLELVAEPGALAYPGRTGLYHLAILHPGRISLATALVRLLQAEARLQGAADHLVSEALYLADPDGNGIELYCDRPRQQWPYRGDALQMDNLPLDLDNLLAQALPEASAAPAGGCVLGHVHLQVAEIDATEHFYVAGLGFAPVLRFGRRAGFVAAGGYHHHIGFNTWHSARAQPPPPGALGLRYFTVELPSVEDLNLVQQNLTRAGIAHEVDSQGVWVNDPAGNSVQLTVLKSLML